MSGSATASAELSVVGQRANVHNRCRDYFFHRRPPADNNAGRHDLYATSARLPMHSQHSQWLSQIGANVNVSLEITPPRRQPRAGRWNRHRRGHHGLTTLEGHCWCRSLRAGSEKVPRRPPWLRRRLVATAGHGGGSQGPGSATVGRPLRQKNPWTLTQRHDSRLTL